ncbi:hypothetical protein CPER28S_02183 [Cellulomonas persica]
MGHTPWLRWVCDGRDDTTHCDARAHRRGLRAGVPARAELRAGRGPDPGVGERQVPGDGTHRAPLPHDPLALDAAQSGQAAGEVGGLPLGGVPPGAPARQRAARVRTRGHRQGGPREPRHRPGGAAPGRDRARARQRWPRTAGRVLHRLARDDERAVDRLRHPLRVRHLQADVRRRLAGREARRLAAPGLPVGVPAPRGRGQGRLRRARRAVPGRRRRREAALGPGLVRAGRPVQLHGPGLRRRPRQHAAPVERPRDARVRPGDLQLR